MPGVRGVGMESTERDYLMHRAPRCLAQTRKRTACQVPAMRNGRCRMHGGKSLAGAAHGRFTHGFFTRDAIASRKRMRAFLADTKALLSELQD